MLLATYPPGPNGLILDVLWDLTSVPSRENMCGGHP